MSGLSDEDREALEATRLYCGCTDSYCSLRNEFDRAVERIIAEHVEAALGPIEKFADLLIEQGDEHVSGCMGQADCAACVHLDLHAAIAAARAAGGGA